MAYDTSGIDPSADLTITGNVTWAGGWGMNVGAGGKAQATTAASAKLYNLIQATGEFSVEAWVAPALVAADNSYMVSYSGGDTHAQFHAGPDQPGLRLHAARLQFRPERHAAAADAGRRAWCCRRRCSTSC